MADATLLTKFKTRGSKQEVLNFAQVLSDDLQKLEHELQRVKSGVSSKATRFDKIKELIEEQRDLLHSTQEENDQLEEAILQLLGIPLDPSLRKKRKNDKRKK